jgi:hypothetical protein
MNYLRGVFSLGSIGLGRSRAFGSWSKYFAGISDYRGSGVNKSENGCENGGENGRTIVAIVFRLSLRCFFSCSITRSFLAILA